MEKRESYRQLLQQVESLIEGERNEVGVLANVTAAIKETMQFFWVGFYLVRNDELALGPFQGSVACYHIGYGKGVCGTAWAKRETLVVKDVEEFPGHIACSSLSRSEIVVPMFNGAGEVVGVLDIDSTELATFDEVDKEQLEALAAIVARQLYR
ncbi:MAG: GAF domain-containing protein [Prevotella sp.]|nr:GAF domain-containing protein [Prevotella sp.]